ncbi:hypothetical protein [Robertmurraya andreesenii]|uniref:Uncharacterized protein n=1 Tax=Anoxybacillus andreesenii TaxID=1325932 RepID=A0ABT9V1R4_9BACL|nr:hypothetical protein [Robertmurraya andreesenii]MDQ0154896.1 hypothetical protein [Robertmurraya andreesenii]
MLIYHLREAYENRREQECIRHGKIYVRVWDCHDGRYMATATNGIDYVWNCYATTPELAKELAIFRLKNPGPCGLGRGDFN